jgi:hypothetical protein
MSLFNRQTTSTGRTEHSSTAETIAEPSTHDSQEDRPNVPVPDDIIQYLESQAYVVAHQFQSLMAGLHYRVQDVSVLAAHHSASHFSILPLACHRHTGVVNSK